MPAGNVRLALHAKAGLSSPVNAGEKRSAPNLVVGGLGLRYGPIPEAFRSGASIQPEFGRQRKLSTRLGDPGDEDVQADRVSTSQTMIIRIDGVRIIAFVPRLR